MKRIYTITIAVLIVSGVFAQLPEKMSYQAVIRDASDNLITDTQIGVRISIIQGSVRGTAVYVETQTPTSNANGLVSIEIGAGKTNDVFSAIDWGNGPYFIKTETDPTGGTGYTISATSQLLSVPYAMHAKTAETVTGAVAEVDPTYTSSQAANITATDITNLGNLSGVNTGDQDLSPLATKTALGDSIARVRSKIPASADGSETKVTAGTNVTVTGAGTTASPYVVNATGGDSLSIGDHYQGGIIFWLDDTGQHGLIAATEDQITSVIWYNYKFRFTGATGDGLYAGAMNTAMIIATQIADNELRSFAAKVCADYSVTIDGVTYGDWYLPSKNELNLLYLQKDSVGAFYGNTYWSSTESDKNNAWEQDYGNGIQRSSFKIYQNSVRAIRAF